MSRSISIRGAWHPQTREEYDAVMAELERVLANTHFCNSKRYPAFLRYVVENTLAGKADLLKERTIGIEVFERPPSYDTNGDTIVRYTAGEVRKRLSLYYHELDRKPKIRISLPAGSYVPEFLNEDEEAEASAIGGDDLPAGDHPGPIKREMAHAPVATLAVESSGTPSIPFGKHGGRFAFLVAAALVSILIAGIAVWRSRAAGIGGAVDEFWSTVLHGQRQVPLCAGTVVFAQNKFSGVTTAGKDSEYPFVSIQTASSIATLSVLLDRNGAAPELQSAASTALPVLRERPVILVGGYNNQWTLRLLEPLRFHFAPEEDASILDRKDANFRMQRDPSLGYSASDDYAVVARFRSPATDNWVVVLAGLGRNGTEAASQFAPSPHYMQLLREKVGGSFGGKNIEAVLKISVIDGKTGAPSIVAVHAW